MEALMSGIMMIAVFGVIAFAIYAKHMQKMAQLGADSGRIVSRQVMEAIESLRREVAELRDTTTKYDLSFDTALQRLESRVSNLERRSLEAGPLAEPARIVSGAPSA